MPGILIHALGIGNMLKGLRQFSANSTDVDRLYQHVSNFASQFTTKPLLDGIHFKGVSLSSGDNTVNHGLGRQIQGWVITNKDAAGDVYATPSKQTTSDKTLILTASTDLLVSIYVF